FIISKEPLTSISANLNSTVSKIVLGYTVSDAEKAAMEFYIPLQLNSIKEKMGFVPNKILISEKFRSKENFFGNNDIKFWKFHFQMFSDSQKTDLDYLSILSKKVMQQIAISDKNKTHWLKNGLRTYLEIQYINRFYKDTRLLGKLPEDVKILGIKPLRYLNISQLNLSERFGIVYQYIMAQNLDQKIGEDYLALSNFNDMAISNFETGSLFDYIAQKISHEKFENFIQNYFAENQNQAINTDNFLNQLSVESSYSSDFLAAYFTKEMRLNFKIKNFTKTPEGYLVNISKNTNYPIPIKITTEDETKNRHSFWFDTPENKLRNEYLIPKNDVRKIQMNDGYIFPEANYRDNYLYTKGLFANTKKIKLKLLKDVPNPEYNEIFLSPKLNFNAYDKVLLGLNLQNKSLFDQQFFYSATPYYSTGAKTFTGSGLVAYSFRPLNTFFRSLQVGASGSYFHYNHDLAYQKFTIFTNLNFMKAMRSDTNRSIMFSYNYFDKDLTPKMQANKEYGRYNLWNIGFAHSDNKLIHEVYLGSNLQLMKDFQKISADAFYRWEYAKNKKISFRFFGGLFISNHTRNNLFDFGISRVSNYAFSYNLLGQSDSSGILSQQFVLAEGGFKSLINATANQWITSTNTDMHIWKMFNIYADAGIYKNKEHNAKFIWDSGVKVKIIPDFLEIFLPVQSSLGFEPSFPGYSKRIRYTLVFNLNAVTNHLRRGWF
ncbi:MAG: aminopeptidase, partial [Cruoricaptor ignavus]|nr:aminopeptidase [Cruoricaptor ignavus]